MLGRSALVAGGVVLAVTGCTSMQRTTTAASYPSGGVATTTTAPGAATVTTASGTTVTVTTTPGAPMATTASGTVARFDAPAGVVTLGDGRLVMLGPKSVVMAEDHPVNVGLLHPGMAVTITEVSPVVYRDGRYAVLNEGVRDADTGSALASDAKYYGLDADTANAAMQVQAGS